MCDLASADERAVRDAEMGEDWVKSGHEAHAAMTDRQ